MTQIITTPRVLEYLKNESGRNNQFNCPHIKDHCGRVLLTMSPVVATVYSDENAEILIKGSVVEMDYYHQRIMFEPDPNFKDFGFSNAWADGKDVIRFPDGCLTLGNELKVFFTSVNRFAHAGEVLHINGQELRL